MLKGKVRCFIWGDSSGINLEIINVHFILCEITTYDLIALSMRLQFTDMYILSIMPMAWLIFFTFKYGGYGF